MKRQCYLCQVSGTDMVGFDPTVHRLCVTCRDRLSELAQREFTFTRHKRPVFLTTARPHIPIGADRKLILTTGYEVDLADEEGLVHLFHAIIGEVTTRFKDTEEFATEGWGLIHAVCLYELHFVAGQLRHMGSGLDAAKLLDEFHVEWDRVAEKLSRDTDDVDGSAEDPDDRGSGDRIKQVVCERRLGRHADWEHWILDGLTDTGEKKHGIGSFIVLHDDDGRFHACGMISRKYSLLCTEDELRRFLEDTLDKFGLILDSGVLEFWCSEYYIGL